MNQLLDHLRAFQSMLDILNDTLRRVECKLILDTLESSIHLEGDSENECPICMSSFIEGAEKVKTACGHEFHTGCLMKWLRTGKSTCPMCRCDLGEALSIDEAEVSDEFEPLDGEHFREAHSMH